MATENANNGKLLLPAITAAMSRTLLSLRLLLASFDSFVAVIDVLLPSSRFATSVFVRHAWARKNLIF